MRMYPPFRAVLNAFAFLSTFSELRADFPTFQLDDHHRFTELMTFSYSRT
jgi:hypothetical protein